MLTELDTMVYNQAYKASSTATAAASASAAGADTATAAITASSLPKLAKSAAAAAAATTATSISASQDVTIHDWTVKQVIQEKLESIAQESTDPDQGNAFFVGDLGEVYRQHLRWKAHLPRIEPFFAVKANPDPMVGKLLASLGHGFDCASKTEIQQVLDMGVDPSRVIYANPCKQASFIRYAAQHGVAKMTFDNAEELHKIKKLHPNAELVLRILTDDSKSVCQLGLKFGAPMHTVESLLQTAKRLGLDVVGVSFHVGSGCLDEHAFKDAITRARKAFDIGQAVGFHFSLLDVGGGFPGADVQDGCTFEKIAAILGPAVDTMFPADVRVIAEPGRFFVASAFTICTSVIGRRTVETGEGDTNKYMYYLNDGIYNSFNCIIFENKDADPKMLLRDGHFCYGQAADDAQFECSLWGPTCDSIDCLAKDIRLPLMDVGDWFYWENMGAYTISCASQFNGFRKSEVLYVNTFR